MTMKLSRKLLSVVLALAICITTVVGCFLTTSAAGSYYTFGDGSVHEETNTATIDVTFNVPEFDDGIFAGQLLIGEVNVTDPALTLIGAVSKTDGIIAEANTDGFDGTNLGAVVFETNDATKGAAYVTITLNFDIKKDEISKEDVFEIAIVEGELSNQYTNVLLSDGVNGVISAGCDHVITVDAASELVTTDNENGLKLYKNSICSLCGERFEYQAVPFGDIEIGTETKTRIEYWDGTTQTKPTATEGEYTIINSAAELAWLAGTGASWSLSSPINQGKFKIADDIKAIVLQPQDTMGDIINQTSAADVQSFFETNAANAKPWVATQKAYFFGTLDGNGATIYGLYSTSNTMGLISHTDGGAVFKNISIQNSYMTGTSQQGFLAGMGTNANSGLQVNGNITIEDCLIKNCYLNTTDGSNSGLVIGQCDGDTITIKNSAFYNNSVTTGSTKAYLYGKPSGDTIENVIAFDTYLYRNWSGASYTNVYTNHAPESCQSSSSIQITADDIKGDAVKTLLPDLAWDSVWAAGANGPEFYVPGSANEEDAKTDSTIYWDGTVASGFTSTAAGTADDPIIINTADELALMVTQTEGKYYKIADGIKEIVLQSETNAAAVKAITDGDNAKTVLRNLPGVLSWKNAAADKTATFNGHFDGNGAAIYGLYVYSKDWNNGALFAGVTAGNTFKNVAIRNSLVGKWAGAAIFVGTVEGEGRIDFENIEISNSCAAVFHVQANRSGVLARGSDITAVAYNNILIYGNTTYASTADGDMENLVASNRLFGYVHNDLKPANETDTLYMDYKNSIILGVMPGSDQGNPMHPDHYTNVYTDADAQEFVDFCGTGGWGWTGATYANAFTAITATDAQGSAAKDNIPNFGWVENGGVWYTGNDFGGYPSFAKAGVMPNYTQNLFDDMTVTQIDSYGVSNENFGVYGTSVNLKANPYIAFTFAFAGEYKDNRDNITVTFTTASGKTVTTTVGNGAGGVSAGWTNNEGAGRYHLYRLKDVSVVDLASPITVTVNYNNTDYNFGAFSVEGFVLDLERAYAMDPCEYYQVRIDAAKALLFYIKMVNARYGK